MKDLNSVYMTGELNMTEIKKNHDTINYCQIKY